MLMVIFGAGASHDSWAEAPQPENQLGGGSAGFVGTLSGEVLLRRFRPPLASDLFHDSARKFGEIIQRYRKLLPVLPRLRRPSEGRSVEEELELLQEEADRDPERKRQLFSVRYYLRDLLSKVSEEWLKETNRVTNYVSLIDQIRHLNPGTEPVCLVNFNYDLLLDDALLSFDYKPQKPEGQFGAHPLFKLFKPHGSVDWARFVDYSAGAKIGPQQLIEQANELKLSDRYTSANACDPSQIFNFNWPICPAIAVPFQNKTDSSFEWPPTHRAYLEELLPQVTKILIIGWQAREAHFLQILRRNLKRGLTHLTVVGKDQEEGWAILKRFVGEIGQQPPYYSPGVGGFTHFVMEREGETLFKA